MKQVKTSCCRIYNKSLNSAILNWRSQFNQNDDIGFSDKELQALRKESRTGREFTWEE